jgi:hypothetical protein
MDNLFLYVRFVILLLLTIYVGSHVVFGLIRGYFTIDGEGTLLGGKSRRKIFFKKKLYSVEVRATFKDHPWVYLFCLLFYIFLIIPLVYFMTFVGFKVFESAAT